MQNHIVPYFLDVGQHMEQVPLLSPGLFRHVTWALIMRFSAQGENWSICAKLAFVPMQFFHQQSQSIVPSINMYTIHKHTVTDKRSKTHTHTHTHSLPQSYLGVRAYAVCYSGHRALDHSLLSSCFLIRRE